MKKLVAIFVGGLALVLSGRPALAASGMFPKMPAATNAYVVSCLKSSRAARMMPMYLPMSTSNL